MIVAAWLVAVAAETAPPAELKGADVTLVQNVRAIAERCAQTLGAPAPLSLVALRASDETRLAESQRRAERELPAARASARGRAWSDLGLGTEGDPAELALALARDLPGMGFDAEGARLDTAPRLERAWEAGAGRVRPKPKPRPRAAEVVPQVIEPDLTRPVRSYGPHESYQPGDRLQHPTLGLGVVQRALPGKVEVQFDGSTSRLVAGRPL